MRAHVLVLTLALVSSLVPFAVAEINHDCDDHDPAAVASRGCQASAFESAGGASAFCSAGFFGHSQGSNVPPLTFAGCGAGQGGAVASAGCQVGDSRDAKTQRNVTWFECFPEYVRGGVEETARSRNVTLAADLDGDGAPDLATSGGCSDAGVDATGDCAASATARNGTFQFFDITYLVQAGASPGGATASAVAGNGTVHHGVVSVIKRDAAPGAGSANVTGEGSSAACATSPGADGTAARSECQLDGSGGDAARNETGHFTVDTKGPDAALAFNGSLPPGDPDFDLLRVFVDGNGGQVTIEVLGAGCTIGQRGGVPTPACVA